MILLLAAQCCFAGQGVEVIVNPEQIEVIPDEEIIVEVFILNRSEKPVQVPRSNIRDGYSHTDVTFDWISYRFDKGQLTPQGQGPDIRGSTLPLVTLVPGGTKRYRFRWTCPAAHFDFLILGVQFGAGGDIWQGSTTLHKAPTSRTIRRRQARKLDSCFHPAPNALYVR